MTAALRVAALCASTHGLQMTSRRHCLHDLGGAAFITTLAPRRAGAEAAPTPDELKKLTLGYQRMQTLLKDFFNGKYADGSRTPAAEHRGRGGRLQ